MGNCQAMEVAAAVIQHPGGKVERLYWPTLAEEVMRSNPGYHVALITLCVANDRHDPLNGENTVQFTRVRLLKPKDTLLFGQVYRLITSQEVSRALRARKNDKLKRAQTEMMQQQQKQHSLRDGPDVGSLKEAKKIDQRSKQEGGRGRHWRPSLHSIAEVGS